MRRRPWAVLVAAIAATACTTTVIESLPPGAAIYVDGEPVAEPTPYSLRQPRSFFARRRTAVELRLAGFEPATFTIRQVRDKDCFDESMAMLGPAIAMILPVVIVARIPWCSQFERPSYSATLVPVAAGAPASPASASAPADPASGARP